MRGEVRKGRASSVASPRRPRAGLGGPRFEAGLGLGLGVASRSPLRPPVPRLAGRAPEIRPEGHPATSPRALPETSPRPPRCPGCK